MAKTKNIGMITFFILTFTLLTTLCHAQEKVAITPFKINAEKELEYLKNAIPDMLFSRLTFKSKEIVNSDNIKDLLSSGFDKVITGSFTKLGNAFSLDVRLYEKEGIIKNYYSSKDDTSKLISAIEEIASKISAKEQEEIRAYEIEKNFKRIRFDSFKHPIYSFLTADINGDGKKELIAASENTLYIYEEDFKTLMFEKKLPFQILIINSADLNKNLKEEIYITAVKSEDPLTQVYELTSKGLEKIYEEGIYINRIEDHRGDVMILAQKPGLNEPFDTAIYEITFDEKELFKKKRLNLFRKEGLNIYQIRPIKYKGKDCYLYIDEYDYYKILDQEGKLIEGLSTQYGGSILGIFRGMGTNHLTNFASLPSRVFILKDGEKDSILTIKNEGSRLFLRSKRFDRGTVVLLNSDDLGFKELRQSESFDGYISDMATDKEKNIVYISVVKGKKESIIVSLR